MKHIKFVPDWNKHLKEFGSESLNIYPIGKKIPEAIEYIDRFTPFLLEIIGDKPINLFVRGSSGAILGGLLVKSIPNTIKIFHVKKEGETSHSWNNHYGFFEEGVNIILDDFISTGSTINAIWEEMIRYEIKKVDVLIVSEFMTGNNNPFPLKFYPEYLITEGEFDNNKFNKEKKETERIAKKVLDLVTF